MQFIHSPLSDVEGISPECMVAAAIAPGGLIFMIRMTFATSSEGFPVDRIPIRALVGLS
jgi:hypothetical protein